MYEVNIPLDKSDSSSDPTITKTTDSTKSANTTTAAPSTDPAEATDPAVAAKKEADEREVVAWAARFDAKQQGGKGLSVSDEDYTRLVRNLRDELKSKEPEKHMDYVCHAGVAVENPGGREVAEKKEKKKGVLGMISKMSKVLKA